MVASYICIIFVNHMQVIMAIVQFIKKHKFFVMVLVLLIFIFSMVVYYMQTKDQSAKRLLDAELENSLGNQLQGIIKRLICETEEFRKKINQINAELQLFVFSNQKLSNKRIELLKRITKPQFQKLALDKTERSFHEHIVYRKQVLYIQKWIEVIEKLVSDVHAIVHCIESHELCSELGYNFEEYHANEIAVKVVYLVVKFKKENVELLDVLLLSKFEEIKNVQANMNMMNKINKMMEELNKEVSGFKVYKKEEIYEKEIFATDLDVQNQWSALYRFGSWLVSMLYGLFRS